MRNKGCCYQCLSPFLDLTSSLQSAAQVDGFTTSTWELLSATPSFLNLSSGSKRDCMAWHLRGHHLLWKYPSVSAHILRKCITIRKLPPTLVLPPLLFLTFFSSISAYVVFLARSSIYLTSICTSPNSWLARLCVKCSPPPYPWGEKLIISDKIYIRKDNQIILRDLETAELFTLAPFQVVKLQTSLPLSIIGT